MPPSAFAPPSGASADFASRLIAETLLVKYLEAVYVSWHSFMKAEAFSFLRFFL